MIQAGSAARTAAALLVALGSTPPAICAAQGVARPLFDGTLSGWTIENTTAGNISVQDGVLRVEQPAGWLRSADTYGDFLLRVEFRFMTDDADSGIFVRAVPDGTFARGWPNNSYQVQLRNPVVESRFPPVGGIFRHGKPQGDTAFDPAVAERLSTGTGQWQLLEIEVAGQMLHVRLNGTSLTRASGIENPRGYIGIQAEAGTVEFRSIVIEERTAQAAQPAPQCATRECLARLADDYIAALVAHDPSRLNFAPNLQFVENLQKKQLGEGLWQGASGGATKFRIYVPDPVTGTIGYMGMMEEGGKPLMIGLRLKVFDGQITEAEHVLARITSERNLSFLQEPRAVFSTPVTARMPRWQMLGIAHSYYEAVDYNDGELSPMDTDCERRENGSPSSADREPPPPNAEVPYWSAMDCTPQFSTNMMAYIDSIDNVRVLAIDEVNGLAFGLSQFRHGMKNKATPIRNVPGVTSRTVNATAFDLPAAHVFKISDGMLHQIEAMGFRADYLSPTGW